jgi:(5-formylfuran-3-yl)methyl phosphate synthase
MSAFLASVRDLSEASVAYRAGADWIDLKEPSAGALGAVSPQTVEQVVAWLRGREREVSISATIGDCWDTLSLMPIRVGRLAAAGVGYAKIGIYAAAPSIELLETIAACCRLGPRIILVCFAEAPPGVQDIRAYANSGISGVMLDTADKGGPGLVDLMSTEALAEFIRAAHRRGLICGLAGSLKARNIDQLSRLGPDYLGFRGALCRHARRESDFSYAAALDVRRRIDAASMRDGGVPAGCPAADVLTTEGR